MSLQYKKLREVIKKELALAITRKRYLTASREEIRWRGSLNISQLNILDKLMPQRLFSARDNNHVALKK